MRSEGGNQLELLACLISWLQVEHTHSALHPFLPEGSASQGPYGARVPTDVHCEYMENDAGGTEQDAIYGQTDQKPDRGHLRPSMPEAWPHGLGLPGAGA